MAEVTKKMDMFDMRKWKMAEWAIFTLALVIGIFLSCVLSLCAIKQAVADVPADNDVVEVEEGDVVVDANTNEQFTVIQGGGLPAGGIGGVYKPRMGENFDHLRAKPRALGVLGQQHATLKAFDIEGSDAL